MLSEVNCPPPSLRVEDWGILLSAYTTGMLEPVIGGHTKEEAPRYLDTIESFFLSGWQQILGF